MSAPSKFSSKGLSIVCKTPLIGGKDVFIDDYTDDVDNYTHVLSATGGYLSSNFNIKGNNEFIEDWLANGLGRHIEVYGPAQQMIWEGFVNEVTGNFGYATFTRGPLMEIGNRITIWYNQIDEYSTLGPSASGTPIPYPIQENFDSQRKYGIIEKINNIGDATLTQAAEIAGLYLEEYSEPSWNPALSMSGSEGELSATISCRGYYDWLNVYPYNNLGVQTWEYLSDIIKLILTEDPNDIFSTNYYLIQENQAIYKTDFQEDKLAKSIIDDLLAIGGGDDYRWTFGFYKDRIARYEPIPTEVEYIYYKTGKAQQVETISGIAVEPWDVLPCKFAAIPTFLTSFPFNARNVRTDPRVFFVEEVSFTAPDQISLTGSKLTKLQQYMAKMGLGELA